MRKKLTDNKKQGAGGGGSAIFPKTATAQRGRSKVFIFCLFSISQRLKIRDGGQRLLQYSYSKVQEEEKDTQDEREREEE